MLYIHLYMFMVCYSLFFVYYSLFGALLTSGGELDRLDISSPPRA